MEIFIIWVALSLVAGAIAGNKGRSSFGFFFLSLALTPLIGLLAALAAQRNVEHTEQAAIDSGTMRRCPYCAELVRNEAIKCKHCASELTPAEAEPSRLTELITKIRRSKAT